MNASTQGYGTLRHFLLLRVQIPVDRQAYKRISLLMTYWDAMYLKLQPLLFLALHDRVEAQRPAHPTCAWH